MAALSISVFSTRSYSNCSSIRGHVAFPLLPLRTLATWSRRITWTQNYPLSMIF